MTLANLGEACATATCLFTKNSLEITSVSRAMLTKVMCSIIMTRCAVHDQ